MNPKKLGDFKQLIMKINNKVNEEMYGRGLDWQKVEIFGDKIVIIACNKRISVLKHLDEKEYFVTRLMDLALLSEFKLRFKQKFEEETGLKIKSLLKDYDPEQEYAGTIIITAMPVEEFLEKSS